MAPGCSPGPAIAGSDFQCQGSIGLNRASARSDKERLKREGLFVTTKVWHDQLAPDVLDRAFDVSRRKVKLDYVDLYMIHWPNRDMDMAATLEALLELREGGLTRAIGVCNFSLPMIRRAIEEIGAPIACHQVEYHPFLSQAPMLAYLRSRSIPLTAYAPLAQGRAANDATLAAVGRQHDATAAQVAIASAGPRGRHRDPQVGPAGKPEG